MDDFRGEAGSFPPPAVDGNMVFFASHDGGLYGIDASTGEKKWRFGANFSRLSTPVTFGGKVFFGRQPDSLFNVSVS